MEIKNDPYVYQRASDKRWIGVIELESTNGKRNRKTVSSKNEKDCWRKLNKLVYEIEHGEYVEPNKDSLIAFLKEYHRICAGYDMWNKNAKRPEKAKWEVTTASLFKMYIDVHFEPYFKDTKLVDIKPITLDKFYNYKLSTSREIELVKKNVIEKKVIPPLSINTVIKLHKFLKAAFNYAVINGILKKNPTVGVKIGSKEDFKPSVYNADQFAKLLKHVANTDDEIPIVLGAGCGFRRGEIFGLRWKDIDFENNLITVEKTAVRFNTTIEKTPKNKTSSRTISAPSYVIETLRKYRNRIGRIDPNEKIITRWKPGSYSERFSRLLKEFDMPHIRLHDLRHYNAVIMMSKGIPDKVAAERLGHANVSTLRNIYQHVLKDMDVSAAEEIDDVFRNAK
jgi:integrase